MAELNSLTALGGGVGDTHSGRQVIAVYEDGVYLWVDSSGVTVADDWDNVTAAGLYSATADTINLPLNDSFDGNEYAIVQDFDGVIVQTLYGVNAVTATRRFDGAWSPWSVANASASVPFDPANPPLLPTLPSEVELPVFWFQDNGSFTLTFQNNENAARPIEVFLTGVAYATVDGLSVAVNGNEAGTLTIQSEEQPDGTYNHLIQNDTPYGGFTSPSITGTVPTPGESAGGTDTFGPFVEFHA